MKLSMAMPLLMLCACTSNWDMQGVDPKDYYALHPIKNRVEMQTQSQLLHYTPSQVKLTVDQIEALRAGLNDAPSLATDAVHIHLSDADMHNEARKEALVRTLRSIGYRPSSFQFDPSATLARDDIEIDVIYAKVVSPNCPDWRRSPVTSYSNTGQGNFECAQETDVGLMVADPHDLEKGTGDVVPDPDIDAKAISDYRSGKDMSATTGSSSTSSSASTSAAGATSGQ